MAPQAPKCLRFALFSPPPSRFNGIDLQMLIISSVRPTLKGGARAPKAPPLDPPMIAIQSAVLSSASRHESDSFKFLL